LLPNYTHALSRSSNGHFSAHPNAAEQYAPLDTEFATMTSAVKKTKVLQRFFMRALCVFVALFIAVVAIRVFPKAPLHAKLPLSRVVLAADGSVLSVQLASDQRYRYWVPRHQFSASLIETTLIKEDRWFYYHPGINPYRMLKAAVSTYSGGARQGGSTLSMQLARMYYDMDTRTLLGKLKWARRCGWKPATGKMTY
jgi:penicillin-binding protein 1C